VGHDRLDGLIDAMKIFVGKLERKICVFGRPSHRWRNDIKLDLKDVGQKMER
jgi:hypothetical protein